MMGMFKLEGGSLPVKQRVSYETYLTRDLDPKPLIMHADDSFLTEQEIQHCADFLTVDLACLHWQDEKAREQGQQYIPMSFRKGAVSDDPKTWRFDNGKRWEPLRKTLKRAYRRERFRRWLRALFGRS